MFANVIICFAEEDVIFCKEILRINIFYFLMLYANIERYP